MRRSSVLLSVAALTLSAAPAFAQANFAGHWMAEQLGAAPNPDAGGGRAGGRGGRAGGGRGGAAAGGWGNDFVITQDAKLLTVTRVGGNGDTIRTVYNLDGTESKNAAAGGAGGAGGGRGGRGGGGAAGGGAAGGDSAAGRAAANPLESTSVAKWQDKKLLITTTGRGGASTLTLWLDGRSLRIESVRPGVGDAEPTQNLTIYRKG